MTRTVWKYTLDLEKGIDFTLDIPGGGTFLTIKEAPDPYNAVMNLRYPKINLWFAVDTENVLVEVDIHIRGTGDEVPPSVNYLGSVFPIPSVVLHVWEKDRVFQDMHIVDGKFIPRSQ